jgi:hypothetical protein
LHHSVRGFAGENYFKFCILVIAVAELFIACCKSELGVNSITQALLIKVMLAWQLFFLKKTLEIGEEK